MPDDRVVTCTQIMQESGLLFCIFCYRIGTCEEPAVCLNVTASTATPINIADGTYCYHVTAFHNGVPVALIQDYFTVMLGKFSEHTNCSYLGSMRPQYILYVHRVLTKNK